MGVDIIFMHAETFDKVYRVSMCGSNFEFLLLDFGFEGHSEEKYWDYDEYGYVEDQFLTKMVWWECVKKGYTSEEYALRAQLALLVMRIV